MLHTLKSGVWVKMRQDWLQGLQWATEMQRQWMEVMNIHRCSRHWMTLGKKPRTPTHQTVQWAVMLRTTQTLSPCITRGAHSMAAGDASRCNHTPDTAVHCILDFLM